MDTGGRTVLDFDEVNPFAQAFYEIDADNDGIITKADLERFVRKNNVADDRLVKVTEHLTYHRISEIL
ncbi:hypothetical protein Aperf_G00000103290 [Anoplocephala perfoliata]